MSWIESHDTLLDHPKTLDLMEYMKWDLNTTIGVLHRFWWYCMRHAMDGDLSEHPVTRLAGAVGIRGSQEAEKFFSSMVDAGFIDGDPYYRIHNWWKYAGPYLRLRYKRHPKEWKRIRALYLDDDELREIYEQESQAASREGSPDGVVPADPSYSLEAILAARMAPNKQLSPAEMKYIRELRDKHGNLFYVACDRLYGNVQNVPGYLRAILEHPDDEELTRQLKAHTAALPGEQAKC